MYNLEFDQAHRSFGDWRNQHPDDPLAPASDAAAYLFSEFDRLHILQSEFFTHDQHFITDHKLTPDPALKRKFEAELAQAKILASKTPAPTLGLPRSSPPASIPTNWPSSKSATPPPFRK